MREEEQKGDRKYEWKKRDGVRLVAFVSRYLIRERWTTNFICQGETFSVF